MSDETTKTVEGTQVDETAATATSPPNGEDKSAEPKASVSVRGGDTLIALKQEREKLRSIKAQNESLQRELNEIKKQGSPKRTVVSKPVSEFDPVNFADDPEGEGAKLLKHSEELSDYMENMRGEIIQEVEERVQARLDGEKNQEVKDRELMRVLKGYEIFEHKDENLSSDATKAAISAWDQLDGDEDLQLQAIDKVAKSFTRYALQMNKTSGDAIDDDDGSKSPLPSAGSADVLSNLKDGPVDYSKDKSVNSIKERASKMGAKVFDKIMRKATG